MRAAARWRGEELMEDRDKIIDRLEALIHLDVDAVHAYEQALDRIEAPTIAARLASFRDDHERHIDDLMAAIRSLGAQPPEPSRDIKGVLLEGMTALRSMTGSEGALKAMKMNEELTNRRYQEALEADLPPTIRAVVERNRMDEARHLAYIEECLRLRAWETAGSGVQPGL
jgi:uncharacterized protein (TIGR02284 family)